jgi:hypothetical protein
MNAAVRAVLISLAVVRVSSAGAIVALVDGYAERPAADSAIAILRALPTLGAAEGDAARLLLANDLEEIGIDRTATMVLESLGSSPRFAPAAFAALARLRDGRGENEALRIEAAKAPWERMTAEDRAEAAYHVARACFRDRRYPEVRFWVERVPQSSLVYPFARFLLAQAEYAFGENGRAIEAAEPIFSSRRPEGAIRALQDRTAVMLGEMLIELGLFEDAADMLHWPAPDSPFRRRIARDETMLESLAAVGRNSFDEAEQSASRIERTFAAEAAEIDATVASPHGLEARAAELTQSWPPRALLSRRRTWTADHARTALAKEHRGSLSRAFAAVWEELSPQPAQSHLATIEAATVGSDGRFLFAPTRDLDRILTAAALLAEPPRAGCAENAARTLRERAAASLIGERQEPGPAELATIAASCGGPPVGGLEARAHAKLVNTMSADARRRSRALDRQQYVVKEAIAHARHDAEMALSLAGSAH